MSRTIYPIWIDGPWKGEEHSIQWPRGARGSYLVRTAKPSLVIPPFEPFPESSPWNQEDWIYFFHRFGLKVGSIYRLWIVASLEPVYANLNAGAVLDVLISDAGKKAQVEEM